MFLKFNLLLYFGLFVIQNLQQITIGQFIEPVLENEKTLELDHKSVTDALSVGRIARVAQQNRFNKLHPQHYRALSGLLSGKENNTTSCDGDEKNEQSNNVDKSLPSDCGKVFDMANKIAGGYDARAGQFPSYVNLEVKSIDGEEYTCGGVIISERYVLTAANCISRAYEINVIPMWNRQSPENRAYKAEKWCLAPDYDDRELRDDFAVIRLRESFTFDRNIQPACLPKSSTTFGTRAHTVGLGWIQSDLRYIWEGTYPDILQVLPVERSECPKEDEADYHICFRSYDSRFRGDSCPGK